MELKLMISLRDEGLKNHVNGGWRGSEQVKRENNDEVCMRHFTNTFFANRS